VLPGYLRVAWRLDVFVSKCLGGVAVVLTNFHRTFHACQTSHKFVLEARRSVPTHRHHVKYIYGPILTTGIPRQPSWKSRKPRAASASC